jgi:hypothetical protein
VSYRLDHAGTTEAAGVEPAGRRPPYALARRCLTARPCFPTEGEGIEPPRPSRTHPFSRRDTAPVAVLPSGPRRLRTCNLPIKSRVLCRVELRSQMWPAGIEPAAPRASSGRSTELSYGHMSRRGWPRTSDLLFVRQALVPTELLALDPGQGVEPRPPGSEPGVLPVRRSRSVAGGRHGAWRPPASSQRLSVHPA